jgi:hypothetical protein
LLEGQLFHTIEAPKSPVSDGRWNHDGSNFLTCDRGGVVLHWQTNFDKLVETIEIETRAEDTVERRLRTAMDIAPPSPRSRAPEPTPVQAEPPSPDFIEASLTRMLNQIEMLVRKRNSWLFKGRMECRNGRPWICVDLLGSLLVVLRTAKWLSRRTFLGFFHG